MLDAEDYEMLNLYADYCGGLGGGHLPFSGGVADQPACVMESLRILHNAIQLAEKDLKPGVK